MTHQEFASIFEKHLRVAEPKRTSLIEEMKTHLDELTKDQNAIAELGYPVDLARKYNREHLGIFHSYLLTLATPILILLVIFAGLLISRIYVPPLQNHYCDISPGNGRCIYPWWLQLFSYIPLLGLAIGVWMFISLIRSLVQSKKPWRLFTVLLALTSGLWLTAITYPQFVQERQFIDPGVITHNPSTLLVELRDPVTHQLIPDNQVSQYVVGRSFSQIAFSMVPYVLGIAIFCLVLFVGEFTRQRWFISKKETV